MKMLCVQCDRVVRTMMEEYELIKHDLDECNAPAFAYAAIQIKMGEIVFSCSEVDDSPVFKKAYDLASHAVKTLESWLGEISIHSYPLSEAYCIFAQIHIKNGSYLDALSYFYKAHRILSPIDKSNLPFDVRVDTQYIHATAVAGIARVLIHQERFEEAMNYVEIALTLYTSVQEMIRNIGDKLEQRK